MPGSVIGNRVCYKTLPRMSCLKSPASASSLDRARSVGVSIAIAVVIAGAALLPGCGEKNRVSPQVRTEPPAASLGDGRAAEDASAERARLAELDREYPLHGLVTGLQLVVRKEARPDATMVGWLRIGSRVRLKREKVRTATCATGWFELYPQGFACAGEGVQVGDQPPSSPLAIAQAGRNEALPYAYYFVKDELVPSFHQPPSRDQQREAVLYAERYVALLAEDARKAQRFLAGELTNELAKPLAVRSFLHRGFFIAGAGLDVRSQRRFVRTVRGQYIKESQLEPRRPSQFHGVTLDAQHALPIAWAVRGGAPMSPRTLPDGSTRFADDTEAPPLQRLAIVPWKQRVRVGDRQLHELQDGHFVRDWFLAVAEAIEKPRGVGAEEPWVHIDLGEQTLVVYHGATPVYATLVSTGLEGHDTPTGLFTIREKHVSDTMSSIGADAGDDRYAIEDVPWTQYFEGSFALHAAFWHERFGLKRSHGCVNLAPLDAHHIFNETWPVVPDGWHGVTTDHTGLRGSHVLITP